MTDAEAIAHLARRLERLDGTYRDHWPRWTTDDYIAARIALRIAENTDRKGGKS